MEIAFLVFWVLIFIASIVQEIGDWRERREEKKRGNIKRVWRK